MRVEMSTVRQVEYHQGASARTGHPMPNPRPVNAPGPLWHRVGARRARFALRQHHHHHDPCMRKLRLVGAKVITAIFLKDTLDAAHNDAENLILDKMRKKVGVKDGLS